MAARAQSVLWIGVLLMSDRAATGADERTAGDAARLAGAEGSIPLSPEWVDSNGGLYTFRFDDAMRMPPRIPWPIEPLTRR